MVKTMLKPSYPHGFQAFWKQNHGFMASWQDDCPSLAEVLKVVRRIRWDEWLELGDAKRSGNGELW